MLEIEIDGTTLQVEDGSTVIEAAHQLGTYIPHFCYHKKLTIAANCRMCLVQIEKAPKPMPACATPVTNGMKVFTHSDLAVKAQKGVMEFLLINHPLDCPICDQGGECQLQDLAVGYGDSASHYTEEKRVVPNKDLGPLVSTDMTRCINCTRCIRFTQEIAGLMELGQAFRGEHAEVMAFVGETVNSELSGNIIDLCPVGALTSKPFRFSARTWELSRRKSVSPHDSLGSNLIVQTKHDRVLRVLPLENEAINECWLSDKDRYSYEGLNSADRVTRPMVKQDGKWNEVDWNVALDYVSHALKDIAKTHGGSAIGGLFSPHATLEELYLGQKLLRGLGSENVDSRLRHSDFSADGKRAGTPWLGMKIADISQLDRVLVVGSFLRKDHPLIAQRLRQRAKRGCQISVVHSADDDLLLKVFAKAMAVPSQLPSLLAQIVKACAELKGVSVAANIASVPVSDDVRKIAGSLVSGRNVGILLGNFAQQHAAAATLHQLAHRLSTVLGASFGFIGEAANSVGAYVANAIPGAGGLNAATMLAQPRKAYVVLGAEPDLDCANGSAAVSALNQAATVVMLTPFKSEAMLTYADVILPVSPFSETSGTFVNAEGRVQSFHASTKPLGDSRPAWKVLRVLGNLLDVPGFEYTSSEAVRAEVIVVDAEFVSGLGNGIDGVEIAIEASAGTALERVADVPIHFADALVRRAPSLQQTQDAIAPVVRINAATMGRLGIGDGEKVRVGAGDTPSIELTANLDAGLPDNAIRIAAAHPLTQALGAMTATLAVEKAVERA
ncbi:MAG: NADH-quinone oxidoreductase subunit G [Rhodocyclaceae bacterium]|nr:NADH-quinone oxidoreductase subunit G [Rhodocyclaceae bacterium]MBP6279862.1 NADH-quinone oxidoreductase subunit G [Rhodocyclaceae bacterium]